ncbi:phytanoyl-CoA dioxygenase family protein [Pedobacter rhodius]|uniref:Phytanoyl-CoA dioxygenase family protein n=1 Tax=Pedobacter rhodius TaxID=3004098 RepID=A0ABT4KVF5_9SPHI|nr:phytanoyl-CoA dioxygenase family protein [Pedobacter sp. SJ11]MCZ4222897.1 phytanoyl-CoA dioxygenase family protein [Pedobacter sp. SJ11]
MIRSNFPWIESPFFNQILESKVLEPSLRALAIDYNRDGYVVLPNFFPEELVDSVVKEAKEKGFNPGFKIKTFRNEQRVQDLWKVSNPCKELASYPPILKILETLYGREPLPFQTLNFKFGSQQRAHSDTIHFSSLPAKFMCGVWVALEDVTNENGPLFYYPGSHRLPEYNFSQIKESSKSTSYNDYIDYEDFIEEIVKVSPIEKKIFHAKKGDALIWSSNILHGGSPVLNDASTRWSQVTHYFFKDCYYYTPMLSNMVTDELNLRNKLTNIATGERIKPSYNGEQLNYLKANKTQYVFNNTTSPATGSISLLLRNLFRLKK